MTRPGDGVSVELLMVAAEGCVDYFVGRPRDRNPYNPVSARDDYEAWLIGWDDAQWLREARGQEAAARWLHDAA